MEYQIVKNMLGIKQVRYECPKCGTSLKNPLAEAGKKDACPECRSVFVVPGAAEKQREEALSQQMAEQAAAAKRKKAEEKRSRKASHPVEQPVEGERGPVPSTATAQPIARPIVVAADKPQRTAHPSSSSITLLGVDILQFAINWTKAVIAAVFILVLIICALGLVLGMGLFCWVVVQLIMTDPAKREWMILTPPLIMMGMAIVYAAVAVVVTGSISVLFKIEENTRPAN